MRCTSMVQLAWGCRVIISNLECCCFELGHVIHSMQDARAACILLGWCAVLSLHAGVHACLPQTTSPREPCVVACSVCLCQYPLHPFKV